MAPAHEQAHVPLHRDPRLHGFLLQAALCIVIALLAYAAVSNAADHLRRMHAASGFGFLNAAAGFDISQALIDYSPEASTFGRALLVGLLNTLLVAAIGIVFATVIGFTVGTARLSKNFLIERLATCYVEAIRNVPLLLQLLFWYNAVLKALPELSSSLVMPGGFIINNRGLFTPRPLFADGWHIAAVFAAAVVLAASFNAAARRVERLQRAPAARAAGIALILLGVPLAAYLASGAPFTFEFPEIGRFNVRGGTELLPEFVALLLGLSIYTAAFIAEAVRAGLMAVPGGQTEAAQALGLSRLATLRLIVMPQAMRVIIPPLTSQYLNLTKNSSLAVAIGYPDLFQVASSVLNISGQAVEVVAITMVVYLSFSLLTALVMNVYNARRALVER
ncbi:MAG: ABC transporter permease subunit [Bradyrhizobiaceae bacterium]|nr:ABC transporter permease subunit [Bradyrhizobiaceae bacterium]